MTPKQEIVYNWWKTRLEQGAQVTQANTAVARGANLLTEYYTTPVAGNVPTWLRRCDTDILWLDFQTFTADSHQFTKSTFLQIMYLLSGATRGRTRHGQSRGNLRYVAVFDEHAACVARLEAILDTV